MTSPSPPQRTAKTFLDKLKSTLHRGRAWLGADLPALFRNARREEALEELETRLLMADVGVSATAWLVEELQRRAGGAADQYMEVLEQTVLALLETVEQPLVIEPAQGPFVILMVGVNGTGKTTTIGKLAWRLHEEGRSVMLAAGDTFRAGAIEQLMEWGERSGANVVRQSAGADPAAVIFDAMESARARDADVLIADTAGRLHTAAGLMDQLKKIRRIMARADSSAPHETLLVLDATLGQNALTQAREFHEAVGVTGLVVTKLDGTAKGGIVLAIARELGLPVRFLSVGESAADLQPFSAGAFTRALFADPAS